MLCIYDLYKYAFFEIFTILKSDFRKNCSIIDFFEKIELNRS